MILVLLGTFHIEFQRPLLAIEKLCAEGFLNEEIIVQSGHTKLQSAYFTFIPFMEPEELLSLYQRARIVITHAGTGSILKGVKMGKKVIAIARLKKYGEVVDDHQLEILNEFSKMKYICAWSENESLKQILTDIDQFTPSAYVSKKQDMIDHLHAYVRSI
jgi:UDP-N-acetylglucosamine transferase subunit ALG13